MGKIIIEKKGFRKRLVKCNGCEGCEFHYFSSYHDSVTHEKEWNDYCILYENDKGGYKLLCAEGGINYNKNQEMMKIGLHPEGNIFTVKQLKKKFHIFYTNMKNKIKKSKKKG
ncbi:MAG: hypothetical protein ACFFG0_08015 [Candidatus Thorarchaeota archaeon]